MSTAAFALLAGDLDARLARVGYGIRRVAQQVDDGLLQQLRVRDARQVLGVDASCDRRCPVSRNAAPATDRCRERNASMRTGCIFGAGKSATAR